MNALTSGLSVSRFRSSNIIATLLVVLIVVALFFIPELIGFRSTTRVAVEPDEVETVLEPGPQEPGAGEVVSPLERVLHSLRQGVSDAGSQVSGVLPTIKESSPVGPAKQTTERSAQEILSQGAVNWEKIRAGESQEAMRTAQRETLAIVRAVPEKHMLTRYAMLNYVNGIDAVLQASPQQFASAEDALRYLEALDEAVTKGLFRESVDRSIYLSWSQINLGKLLEGSRVARTKASYHMPFNPRLTLHSVQVRHPGDHKGNFIEQLPVFVDIHGYVIGNDVKKIDLYLDDRFLQEVSLLPADEKTSRRYFYYTIGEARGVYTFKVYDEFGEQHVKRYSFYPKARAFPWRLEDGAYRVPYQNVDDKTDLRLDRFFKVEGRNGSSDQAFTRF